MTNIELLKETPITMVELKEKLEKINKKHELSFRANKTSEYLGIFAKQKQKEIEGTRKKLNDLNILRLKETQITKIIDTIPKDMDSLKAIFAGENLSLKQEDMKRVLECLK